MVQWLSSLLVGSAELLFIIYTTSYNFSSKNAGTLFLPPEAATYTHTHTHTAPPPTPHPGPNDHVCKAKWVRMERWLSG